MRGTLVAMTAVVLLAAGCSSGSSDSDSETTTKKTSSAQTTQESSGPSDSEVLAWAREQTGMPADGGYQSTGGWMDYLVGARVERSNLYITLQVTQSDEAIAKRAETFYVNTLNVGGSQPAWTGGINWVIVEDGTGTVITQAQV